jgi:hypothetical protein
MRTWNPVVVSSICSTRIERGGWPWLGAALSFLASTPGVFAPTNPFGGFLMKDIMFLGAALYTAAEALEAAKVRKRWTAAAH